MDVYKIGVSLAMSSNAPQVLAALSQQLLHVHAGVHRLQGSLSRLHVAIGGAFAVAGGVGILKTMGSLVEHGHDLVKIQQDMAQAGVAQKDIQESVAKAWEMTARYQNMGATEVMKMINDGRMVFGSQHDATHHVEDFVQAQGFLKAYQGGKHAAHGEGLMREINAAMKSGEIAGKISPAEMQEHVKQLTAMKVAYGEGLKMTDYLVAQRAGGVAMRNTDDSFRYGIFPALVQENGSNAGVMLMTAFNKIASGTGNRTKSLEHMQEIGLLNKEMLEYNKSGMIKGLKTPDAIKGSRDFATNPAQWVMETLKPLLDKVSTDPIKQAQLISGMFPDRNAAKLLTEILQQHPKFEKDAHLMQEARKSMNAPEYMGKSYEGQKQGFNAQVDNLQQILGGALVGPATNALKKLNEALSGMAQWAKAGEHADTIKAIGIGIAGLGASLAGAGAVAILAALGPAGWIALGIGALVTAVVAFKPQLDAADKAFNAAAVAVGEAIRSVGSNLMSAITGLPGQVGGAISAAFSAIAGMIKSAIAGVTGGATLPGAKSGKTLNPGDELPGVGKQSSYVPKGGAATTVHTAVHLDGRQIASNTARHFGRASTNVAAATGFDGRRNLASPDMGVG